MFSFDNVIMYIKFIFRMIHIPEPFQYAQILLIYEIQLWKLEDLTTVLLVFGTTCFQDVTQTLNNTHLA